MLLRHFPSVLRQPPGVGGGNLGYLEAVNAAFQTKKKKKDE